MMKKGLTVLLTIVLLFNLLPYPVRAQQGATPIYTAQDLSNIRHNLGGSFVLMNDIDLAGYGAWAPIGNWDAPFTGVLDGQGYAVRNMVLTGENSIPSGWSGLFALIEDATVKNLSLENMRMYDLGSDLAGATIGGIAGEMKNALIENCHISGSMDLMFNNPMAGGITIGGIVGRGFGEIHYSVNRARITVATSKTMRVGGIIGTITYGTVGSIINGTLNMTFSRNEGDITLSPSPEGRWASMTVGGLVGDTSLSTIRHGSYIISCANVGNINLEGRIITAGGIIGSYSARPEARRVTIRECYNAGDISALSHGSSSLIGGLLGHSSQSLIENSFNTGTLISRSTDRDTFVGGIAGRSLSIANSYNAGRLEASTGSDRHTAHIGGIAGEYRASLQFVIDNGFFIDTAQAAYTIGNTHRVNAAALSATAMRNRASFAGFDFNAVWDIDPGINNGMPFLRNTPMTSPLLAPAPTPPPAVRRNIRVNLNGENIPYFNEQPYVIDGRIYLPLIESAGALGGQVIMLPDGSFSAAPAQGIRMRGFTLTPGSDAAIMDGIAYYLEEPLQTVERNALVPAQFLADAFYAYPYWDAAADTLYLTTGEDAYTVVRAISYATPSGGADIQALLAEIEGSLVSETDRRRQITDLTNRVRGAEDWFSFLMLTSNDVYISGQYERIMRGSPGLMATLNIGDLLFNDALKDTVTGTAPSMDRYKQMIVKLVSECEDDARAVAQVKRVMDFVGIMFDTVDHGSDIYSRLTELAGLADAVTTVRLLGDGRALAEQLAELEDLYAELNTLSQSYLQTASNLEGVHKLSNNDVFKKVSNGVTLVSAAIEAGMTVWETYNAIADIKMNADMFVYYDNIFDVIDRRSTDPWLNAAANELRRQLASDFDLYLTEIARALADIAATGANAAVSIAGFKDPTGVVIGFKIGKLISNVGLGVGDTVERAFATINASYLSRLFADELEENRLALLEAWGKPFEVVAPIALTFRKNYETLHRLRLYAENAALKQASYDGALLGGALRFLNNYDDTLFHHEQSVNRIEQAGFR